MVRQEIRQTHGERIIQSSCIFWCIFGYFCCYFWNDSPPVLCMLHQVQYAHIFCYGRNWKFVKRALMLGSINYVIMYIYVVPCNSVRLNKCRYLLFVFVWYLFIRWLYVLKCSWRDALDFYLHVCYICWHECLSCIWSWVWLPFMIVLSIYSVGNTTILCGLGCLLTFDVLESRAGELEPGVAERLDIFPWPGDVVSAI